MKTTIGQHDVVTPAPLPDGWYWYCGEPVKMTAGVVRGYNFTTKEEWRKESAQLDRAALTRIEHQS
jgi:hypothetical protein